MVILSFLSAPVTAVTLGLTLIYTVSISEERHWRSGLSNLFPYWDAAEALARHSWSGRFQHLPQ